MTRKVYRDSFVAAHLSNTVASQIAAMREVRGWTQTQLAEKAGMKQSRISSLEDPNYENFEAGTLRRIASAFDVGVSIKFVPFSEIVHWSTELTPENIVPREFAADMCPVPRAQSPYSFSAILSTSNRSFIDVFADGDGSRGIYDVPAIATGADAADDFAAWSSGRELSTQLVH